MVDANSNVIRVGGGRPAGLHLIMVSMLISTLGYTIKDTYAAQVEVEPKEVLVLPRQNATFMCRVSEPLQYCRVEIPGMPPQNLNRRLSNPDVSYYGNGLEAGQCGFVINNIQDKHNGQIKCTLGLTTESHESVGTMQLIVARSPRIPELDLSRGTDSLRVYKMYDTLQASCIVKDGRPVANISWFLDEEPLYRDGLSMPTVVEMAKENLQSKIQNLSRILQPQDNGKFLRCVASHPAYQHGRAEARKQLDVKYAPLPQSDLDKFGYTLGQAGVISVVIDANPKPQIEWLISGEHIKEGHSDRTGRIEAAAARDLGKGHYEVNLRIAAINKEDTERMYILTAYNDMGPQEYRIKISTSPEPEGLDLGIGGVVAIVVSVLILVMLVFVLIFARVTGRWCFTDQSSESKAMNETDTESADVKPKSKALRMLALLKRTTEGVGGDKKSKQSTTTTNTGTTNQEDNTKPNAGDATTVLPPDSDPAEKTPSQKDTGGAIVYAELDLLSKPAATKPVIKKSDDKTEYAEIIYKDNASNNNNNTKNGGD